MNFDNNDLGVTRDSEKLICYLYHCFLKKRKNNISKSEAKEFKDDFFQNDKKLAKIDHNDIDDMLCELAEHGHIKYDIIGNVTLTNSLIAYMENRFKKGLADVWEILSDFIPFS